MRRGVLAALLAVAAGWADAAAQAVSLHLGGRTYHGGSEAMAAVRTEFPLHEAFLVELAGSVADPREDEPVSVSSVFEAQLQFFVPIGETLMPYLGAGAGVAKVHDASGAEEGAEGMVSVGAGVRAAFSERLSLVVDARLRAPFQVEAEGAHTDVTIGARYQLRRPDRPRFRGAASREE